MLNTECNGGTQPAGFRARDGKLWFPTQDGIAIVDPRAITSNELPPPVAIEEFILDNQPVVFRAGAQIPVGVESFEIHYTGLSFVRPEQVRFKYKLEGLDTDWIDAGTRRTVENHRANVCHKLNLSGSHSLLKFALEHKSQLV